MVTLAPDDPHVLEARLKRMSNEELLRFGQDVAYMCSPKANLREPPRPEFITQLDAARAEWVRRTSVITKSGGGTRVIGL